MRTPKNGFWLQHVHDSVQNYMFANGSFFRSFPVLALGSLVYLRQQAALQCAAISFDKHEHAWILDGENGLLLYTNSVLYYINKQKTHVVLFEHKCAPESSKTYVTGRMGTQLTHMQEIARGSSDEQLEHLLFVWLNPAASFQKTTLLQRSTIKLQEFPEKTPEYDNVETWGKKLFFVLMNAQNPNLCATVKNVQPSNEEQQPSFLSSEEWSCKGQLKLHRV